MIPSALSGQLQRGLADYLRFSFWSSTPGMENVIGDLLDEPGALLKGPYISLRLPFVRGGDPRFFPDVPLSFAPHAHQERAFVRLGGRRKLSTLIATGTGSGKTESFLIPILDHCLKDHETPGIKAILIYPMNALATDQALRIAKMVHANDKLRGKVTAGLYIGESQGHGKSRSSGRSQMGPTTVITDRTAMQENPPNILLTNYKMLDYLLLRPGDQGVWRHNERGTLRFLVVDEIHTFDGAQGTDLACLVRRLKRRLQVDDGSLCCVGTSATLGGPDAANDLRAYAKAVFGEPFDEGAVIGETRQDVGTFLLGPELKSKSRWDDEPGPSDKPLLDPSNASDPQDWLNTQVKLWFGGPIDAPDDRSRAVRLGEMLLCHAAFQALLNVIGGRTRAIGDLVATLARSRSTWRDDPELARLCLQSLLGLVSAARSWRPELPETAVVREASGNARPTQPLVEVRVQLWQRELRRLVASVGSRPRLRHSDDLDKESRKRHLPMVHCRDCGALGWACLVDRDKKHILRTDLNAFYRAFFANDPQVEFLYPKAAVPPEDPSWRNAPIRVATDTLTVLEPDEPPLSTDDADGSTIDLVPASSVRSSPRGAELSRDCPFCGARDSLTLVGFRAATLTSVFIDQLFASRFNDDKKLITFSDSVQDAAHRAGFFGARTWRTNLRVAMLKVIANKEGLTLHELADALGPTWKKGLDLPTWVATFLAPTMSWLHDWGMLQNTGSLPEDSDLPDVINRRLGFEVVTEFGMQAGIGRSLSQTGAAAVFLDRSRLDRAVQRLLEPLRNEVPGLRDVSSVDVRRFILGLLHHLRSRGGIMARSLPPEYVLSGGRDTYAFKLAPELPAFGPTSRMPALLTDRPGTARFDTWGTQGDPGWYARWVYRCFGAGKALTADPGSTYLVALPGLVATGLLDTVIGKHGERIWGLSETAPRVTAEVSTLVCDHCGHRAKAGKAEASDWAGVPCLSGRCTGRYAIGPVLCGDPQLDYFARLYQGGDLQRIFTEEHTGLLSRAERERVEVQFKARKGPVDDPDARRPWYPNLLSCTPTLEMGIDIGDLSAAILCSIPPAQANYLQRIGRAGRQDGNSLILAVANARPHDQYFFAAPSEMFEGEVTPPGVFLDAPAVLERQLTAFCFDRWVAAMGIAVTLPPILSMVFKRLDDPGVGHFPFDLLAFVETHQPTILREFREMFADTIQPDTESHLSRFMIGTDDGKAGLRWDILNTLRRERKHRDSLSTKARSLHDTIKKFKDIEAKPKDFEDQLERLESEKEALQALVASINARQTLEFFTDEGLLPNYAFPESAVRLNSVIWRRKKKVPKEGSKYETWTYEYRRSPASALSELAPHADFFAGGRKVRIDQVDLMVSGVESWRFCNSCNHAQCVEGGDEAASCPSCGSASWCDDGQRFRMLRLRQVFANAPDRESRIKDDQDDRQPPFFQRQVLVDVRDQDRGGAWKIDEEKTPFGFEFLRRATFREVNFGELSDQGPKSIIAGHETVRPGFEICARCGKVQKPGKDPEHALSCPSRKDGAKQEMERCLYLYREFASEALRLLLPVADTTSTKLLHSFVAALQLGLKLRFGGSVDHLRTTVYSDPVPDSALRKQYLVLYDTVPGGTGYLKQLVTSADPTSAPADGLVDAGRAPPLFEAMQLALERIEHCDCWDDPDRDGCYHCLYAYRNARDMDDTSAQVAADLLRRVLAGRGKLKAIGNLGDISVSGLMDSVLEVRFVEALREIRDQGAQAKLKPAVLNQKPCYRWTCGDAEWTVEPQVNLIVGVPVSIDFVMRPATTGSDRLPIAVFLDGWNYHQNRIGQDLRQRMALLASGQWDVWTFTWADLDQKLFGTSEQKVAELLAPDGPSLKSLLQRAKLAAWRDLADTPLFLLFEKELLGPPPPWKTLGSTILAARMKPVQPGDAEAWRSLVERLAPPVARPSLKALAPRLSCLDQGQQSPFLEMMAVHDGKEAALVASLDDRPEYFDRPGFKAAWHGYLRLFQLLRGLPRTWFMTTTGLLAGDEYRPIQLLREGPSAICGEPSRPAWSKASTLDDAWMPLAKKLIEDGVREPEIGLDIPDSLGNTWVEAELCWEEERVAVTSRERTAKIRGAPSNDWVVLLIEEVGESSETVIAALHRDEVC